MNWRTPKRVAERQRANAELCGVALTEWLALPRTERRRLLAAAKARP